MLFLRMLLFVSSYIFIGPCIDIFLASYINSLPERNYETGQIFANAGENALLQIFLQKACRWFFQIDKRLSEYSEPSDWPSDGRLTRWNKRKKQDPVSTLQKTGWTIHSSFMVLSGLEKGFTLDVITRGQSTTIFLCIGPSNNQPTGWS